MINYKWQAPAPNMQLLFKQAVYNLSSRAFREQEVCSLGLVRALRDRKGNIRAGSELGEVERQRYSVVGNSGRMTECSQEPLSDPPSFPDASSRCPASCWSGPACTTPCEPHSILTFLLVPSSIFTTPGKASLTIQSTLIRSLFATHCHRFFLRFYF